MLYVQMDIANANTVTTVMDTNAKKASTIDISTNRVLTIMTLDKIDFTFDFNVASWGGGVGGREV